MNQTKVKSILLAAGAMNVGAVLLFYCFHAFLRIVPLTKPIP
ncbi:hypothetical protein VAT7223_02925 [Vibrio atlanticus]|uniref:Uncharacterized protein n=1 Tax=Vibrio atlanticus TaxID=693153 RepID=A0A1C3IWT4_9VIBR|nr:hypothetical protein VAT7223_02925 [Vibrio atlanticus]